MSSSVQTTHTSPKSFEKVCALDPAHSMGLKGLLKDPLGRKITLPDGTLSEEVMRVCLGCYNKALAEKQTKQALKCAIDPTHETGKRGLSKHPLGRKITLPDGTLSQEVIKVCNACYRNAFAEKQTEQGLKCGVDPTHNIGSGGLRKDPLGRRVTLPDGSESEEIMRLCVSCYQKTLAEKQTEQGLKCGVDPTHNMGAGGLRTDPLGRKKTLPDGSEGEEVMSLCNACYHTARRESQAKQGLKCSFDPTHNIGSGGLRTDPLGHKITLPDGTQSEEVIKVCNTCYCKALRNKKKLQQASSEELSLAQGPQAGGSANGLGCYNKALAEKQTKQALKCAIDPTHETGKRGLSKDPLGRKITLPDGTLSQEVIKVCNACYRNAFAEKQTEQGLKCGVDPTHNIGSGGLRKDPLGRRVTLPDGSESEEIMRLCVSCYQKTLAEKQTEQGLKCGVDPTHNMGAGGLRTDPLGRKKTLPDGTQSEEVIKVCNTCYWKAFRNKKKLQQASSEELSLAQGAQAGGSANGSFEASDELAAKALLELREQEIEEEDSEEDQTFASASAFPAVVKQEPIEEEDPECHIAKVLKQQRAISNKLPILQDPLDHERSLLLQEEGPIEHIKCAHWASLAHIKDQQKKSILTQVQRWLRLNEHDRSGYEKELDDIFEITIPVDEGPLRGVSTFAKKDLEPFTVIGPYAGTLHKNEESLEKAIRSQGSYNTLSYLFATRSSKRAIDGFSSGNVTTLTNTSQLEGQPAWKTNNVVPVLFGKNLVFYITTEAIAKGEEILVDYGATYNPKERIKQESLEF